MDRTLTGRASSLAYILLLLTLIAYSSIGLTIGTQASDTEPLPPASGPSDELVGAPLGAPVPAAPGSMPPTTGTSP